MGLFHFHGGYMKKLFVCLGLLTCLLFFASCGEAETSYQKGISLFQAGDYEGAGDAFRLSLSQGKKDAVLYADLALATAKAGDNDTADDYLSIALEKAPEASAVLKRAGLLYMAEGRDDEALTYLNRSLTTPEDAMSVPDLETCAFAAEIEARNGCFDEAIRLYDLLINQGYYPMEHQYLAGIAYMNLEQTAAANQYFELCFAHSDVPAEYYLTVYNAFYSAGEYTRAENWFNEGLKLFEGASADSSGMTPAAYYEGAGKSAEAMALFTEETSAAGLLAYAKSLISCGEYTLAEEAIQSALALGHPLPDLYFTYYTLMILKGRFTDAKRLLTEVRASGESRLSEAADWNEIIMTERQREYSEALLLLENYRKTYPADRASEKEYAFLLGIQSAGEDFE